MATTAADEHELARIRNRRGGFSDDGGSMHAAAWKIAVTEEARRLVGQDAGLRLADLTSPHGAPSFETLDAGAEAGARAARDRCRARDVIVGELVRNDFDGSTMLLLDGPTLRLLSDHGLVEITALDDLYSAVELEGRRTLSQRARGLASMLRGWKRELDTVTGFLVSLVAFTGALATLVGALIALLRLVGVL